MSKIMNQMIRRSFIETCLKLPVIGWLLGGNQKEEKQIGVDMADGKDFIVYPEGFNPWNPNPMTELLTWIPVSEWLPVAESTHSSCQGACSELLLLYDDRNQIMGFGRRYAGHANPDTDLRFVIGPAGLFVHGVTHWAKMLKGPQPAWIPIGEPLDAKYDGQTFQLRCERGVATGVYDHAHNGWICKENFGRASHYAFLVPHIDYLCAQCGRGIEAYRNSHCHFCMDAEVDDYGQPMIQAYPKSEGG